MKRNTSNNHLNTLNWIHGWLTNDMNKIFTFLHSVKNICKTDKLTDTEKVKKISELTENISFEISNYTK